MHKGLTNPLRPSYHVFLAVRPLSFQFLLYRADNILVWTVYGLISLSVPYQFAFTQLGTVRHRRFSHAVLDVPSTTFGTANAMYRWRVHATVRLLVDS